VQDGYFRHKVALKLAEEQASPPAQAARSSR
jgi:hypothetical protein